MNELVTPPGYVEYPRDSKYRGFDSIDRLQAMVAGRERLTFSSLIMPVLLNFGWTMDTSAHAWRYYGCKGGLAVVIFITLRSALSRFFFAKGWSSFSATVLSLALTALASVSSIYQGPASLWLIVTLAIWVGVLFWFEQVFRSEFRKHSVKLPAFVKKTELDIILRDLRDKESNVVRFNGS